MDIDKIKEKIQKLLTLAEHNTNQHEAAVAAEKAARLIHEYGLALDDVQSHQAAPDIAHETVYNPNLHVWRKEKPAKPDPEPKYADDHAAYWAWHRRQQREKNKRRVRPYPEEGWTNWYRALAMCVGKISGCDAGLGSPLTVTFVGPKGKVEMAAFLMSNIYARIQQMADNAVEDYCAEVRARGGESPWRMSGKLHPKQFRKGFVRGCASAITNRLIDLAKENEPVKPQAVNARALMVTGAIEVYKTQHWPEVGTVSEKKVEQANAANKGSIHGLMAGWEAGKDFELQRGLRGGESGAVKALKGK